MSLGHTLGKVEGHLGVDDTPVLPPSGPLFRNIYHSQIQHFQQTVIGGKDGFGLGHLAQLAVETLNGVGYKSGDKSRDLIHQDTHRALDYFVAYK